MSEEKTVWTATPSQVLNLGTFALCILFIWLVVPVFIMLWKWLTLKNTQYELTTERLIFRTGVLNKKTRQIELYRIRDYEFEQPFFLRLFSLGNLLLNSSDVTEPVIVLHAIANGEDLRNQIRNLVEQCRVKKGVRSLDVEAHAAS